MSYRDDQKIDRAKLFFSQEHLWIDRGGEGMSHATVSDLFRMIFLLWFSSRVEQTFTSMSGCQIEKPKIQAAAPDLILYIGKDYPRWQEEESRYINLERFRVPDLVGEISDTTLADDLDAKKQIYARLSIPEYWVIDVRGSRVFAFRLQADGKYQQLEESIALTGLSISLLEGAIDRLTEETNASAALWFSQQIARSNG